MEYEEYSDFIVEDGTLVKYKGSGEDIVIPSGVTCIGEAAFRGCSSLCEITIPDSVTRIESLAFYSCTSLRAVTIPESVTSLGVCAFSWCEKLEKITLPPGLTAFPRGLFLGCGALQEITLPGNVAHIGNWAFWGCRSLRKITLPDSVTVIGEGVFTECVSLQEITIPAGTERIEKKAFSACKGLWKITIPGSKTKLGEDVFQDCCSIRDFTLHTDIKLEKPLQELLLDKKEIRVTVLPTQKENERKLQAALFYAVKPSREYTDSEVRMYHKTLEKNSGKIMRIALRHEPLLQLLCSNRMLPEDVYGKYYAAAVKNGADVGTMALLMEYGYRIHAAPGDHMWDIPEL